MIPKNIPSEFNAIYKRTSDGKIFATKRIASWDYKIFDPETEEIIFVTGAILRNEFKFIKNLKPKRVA